MLSIRRDKVASDRILDDVPGCSRIEHRLDVDPFAVNGQGNYLHLGQFGADLPGSGNPAAAWHADVHDDDVGMQPTRLVQGRCPVDSLADHLHAVLPGKKRLDTFSQHFMVVCQHYPDGHDTVTLMMGRHYCDYF